jgi:Fe-S-cluster containining protein
MIEIDRLKEIAKQKENHNRKFFMRLRARVPKDLDSAVHNLHREVFEKISCLDCANCCKTLGPRINDKDIAAISKYLNIKKNEFVKKYLKKDEEGDYIFQAMPCPFLSEGNYCSVYNVRPKACADYPHTSRSKFQQRFNLTQKNIYICPAVYEIVEGLKKQFTF